MTRTNDRYEWRCQECGKVFKTVAAAEKAAFGDRGCPKCGSSDIDNSLPLRPEAQRTPPTTVFQSLIDENQRTPIRDLTNETDEYPDRPFA